MPMCTEWLTSGNRISFAVSNSFLIRISPTAGESGVADTSATTCAGESTVQQIDRTARRYLVEKIRFVHEAIAFGCDSGSGEFPLSKIQLSSLIIPIQIESESQCRCCRPWSRKVHSVKRLANCTQVNVMRATPTWESKHPDWVVHLKGEAHSVRETHRMNRARKK